MAIKTIYFEVLKKVEAENEMAAACELRDVSPADDVAHDDVIDAAESSALCSEQVQTVKFHLSCQVFLNLCWKHFKRRTVL